MLRRAVRELWGASRSADSCVRVWEHALPTWPLTWPVGARVLEIGCQDVNWLSLAVDADDTIQVVGLDWRGALPGPGERLKGDVLQATFAPASFDAIVMISALEHIGLGHYAKDPIDPDGDMKTMALCATWLRPGGWVYADVPYDPTGYRLDGTAARIYDDQALRVRLNMPGLRQGARVWASMDGALIERPTTMKPRAYCYVATVWWQETPHAQTA